MLRNIFLILGFTAFMSCNSVLAVSTTQNTNQTLSQLETKFFEHQYVNDNDTDRISRIEQFIFGCTQTGSTDNRLQHILSAVPSENTEKIFNSSNNTTTNDTYNQPSANSTNPNSSDSDDNQTSTADSKPDASNYSSYPRVTTLEQELLSHTYETDSLSSRLARLETKAFGQVSQSNDLGQRVDNLDDYAQRHDIYGERKIAKSSNTSLAFVPPKSMRTPAKESYPNLDQTDDSTGSSAPQKVYNSKTGSFVGSIEERVAMMEAQEFDHTYPEKPLDKRLSKLEKKILPNQDNEQLGLFERTGKLWVALHPADAQKVATLLASRQLANPPSASQTNKTDDTSTNNKRPSWIHKIANSAQAMATAPYSGSFPGTAAPPGYAYPGAFYMPQTGTASDGTTKKSTFIGASFGPGAGPFGIPVGFW